MARLSAKSKGLVYSNLAKYARSGMGLDKACESLLRQPGVAAAERRLYQGLLDGLKAGKGIGDALGSAGAFVSPLEHEIVAAAESGGQLEAGFAHLADYFRRLDRTRRKILKGLAYPLVLLHLAIPVSTLAVAAFGSFRLDGSGEAFDFAGVLARSGAAMLDAWLGILLALAAAWWLGRLARRSAFADALLAKVPLLGKARRAVAMERFSQVLSVFLQAGRTMSVALDGASRASGSGLIRSAGHRGAATVAAGNPLAAALFDAPRAFPNDFSRGIAAAEEAGQLDRELAEWSRFYSDSAAEAMDQLGEWTPRLFYWAVLLLVAALIVRSTLAYRDLIQGVLDLGG